MRKRLILTVAAAALLIAPAMGGEVIKHNSVEEPWQGDLRAFIVDMLELYRERFQAMTKGEINMKALDISNAIAVEGQSLTMQSKEDGSLRLSNEDGIYYAVIRRK